jgi:transcriptional regulator with XRE-family HTH domain
MIVSLSNNSSALKMLAVQCKMARVALGLGLRDLAELAKVAPATISRLESGEELKPRTVDAIRRALEAAGVEFIGENGGGPGVRLKKGMPMWHKI